jgi:lipopolysaccharide biosynthesis glycosyltransferase
MKIGVCTLMIGEDYTKRVKYCRKSLEEYCEKHSYDLCECDELYDNTRDPMWSKILVLQKFLPDYDYLVWIDADIIILNPEYTLEYFIVGFLKNKDMMVNYDFGHQLNTGFWFIKNCVFTQHLLKLIYSLFVMNIDYHEQGVLTELYNRDTLGLKQKCVVISETQQRLFNSLISIHHIGDFNIHFMGIRGNDLEYVSSQHYKGHKDNETDDSLACRMDWYKKTYQVENNRYSLPTPTFKIGVCTLGCGEKYADDVIHYGRQTMIDYCNKWGYDFVTENKSLDEDLPPHWSKLLLMLQLMESDNNYEYIVWFDSDIIIMNDDIQVTDLILLQMKDTDFLLSRDISNHINTGVWIVKNSEYAREMIRLVYKLPELRYRNCEDQDVFNALYDMNAMDIQNKSVILPQVQQTLLNCCVGCYKKGAFLIHFFSIDKEHLFKAFNDFYPKQRDNECIEGYTYRKAWMDRNNY